MLPNTHRVRVLLFLCFMLPGTALLLWNLHDAQRMPWNHPDFIERSRVRSRVTYVVVVLTLLAATVPGAMEMHESWKNRRQRRRVREGLCGECGYDLRGADGPCPECGAARPTDAAG